MLDIRELLRHVRECCSDREIHAALSLPPASPQTVSSVAPYQATVQDLYDQ